MIKLIPFECYETQYFKKIAVKHVCGKPTFWNPRSFLERKPFLSLVYKTEILEFKKKEG